MVNRLLCLGFSLAIPGMFGRPVLLHCCSLENTRQEPVYRLEARPLVVLTAVLANVATAVLRSPLRSGRVKTTVKSDRKVAAPPYQVSRWFPRLLLLQLRVQDGYNPIVSLHSLFSQKVFSFQS